MTALVGVTVCVLLMTRRSQAHSLSLVFERYSDSMDFYVQDVAFLWLTNSSDKTYWLPMAGGTNSICWDTPPGLGSYKQQPSQSYMVECEFSGQANPKRQVSILSWGQCAIVAPHSAVRLRVALPPKGEKRRVAVLCAEQPSGNPSRFWTNGIGLRILRELPRSARHKVLWQEPAVLRVWCDRELSHPAEGPTK